jgi:hypothetical protein
MLPKLVRGPFQEGVVDRSSNLLDSSDAAVKVLWVKRTCPSSRLVSRGLSLTSENSYNAT